MRRTALLLAALAATTHVARAEDDPLYTCHVPPAGTKLSVSFRPDTSLADLATWVTGFTCKNVVFSSDVPKRATSVTIISPTKMTPKQALALFVDAVEATGLVVQVKPDTILIKLGPKMPRNCPDTAAASTRSSSSSGSGQTTPGGISDLDPPPSPRAEKPPESEADNLAAIDKGIRKIDATHYEITVDAVDRITANPMAVAKGARVVPSTKPAGFKLYAISPGSMFGKLGFQNGDTITSINAMAIDTPDKALEVYVQIREASSIDVAILRQGKPATIAIKVKR